MLTLNRLLTAAMIVRHVFKQLTLGSVALVLLTGCTMQAHAPSMPLYGSFFPVWLLASLLGIMGAVLIRVAFIRVGLNEHLPAPALVYFCLAILFSVIIWALWTGELAL